MNGTYGAAIMRSNPDMLQVFMPKYTAEGAAYNDMYIDHLYILLQVLNLHYKSD